MRSTRTRPRGELAVRTCAVFAAALLARTPFVSAQRYASRVDAVRIDVGVLRDGRPVTGLTAADFEVRDKGVAQQIDLVASENTPVDVVLALDVSGSVRGERLARLRAAGLRLIDALQSGDQASLLTFGGQVLLRVAFTGDVVRLRGALDLQAEPGDTALGDALHAAMVLAQSGSGRPLVIVFSDGADTGSFLRATAVEDTARRTAAVVYGVTTSGATGILSSIVRLTGGNSANASTPEKLNALFAGILDEFRHSYVLSYTPSAVPAPGWHDVKVRLKNGKGDIQARPGYMPGP